MQCNINILWFIIRSRPTLNEKKEERCQEP
uniref:Uncharacterized protein n=1 Tax=Anguilla anguilla TaxID=7936 RepID=A0A0E9PFK0_ANGAN